MYRIKKGDELLAVTAELTRCTMQENGTVKRDPNGAGIIYGGTIYNLPGYDTVTVERRDDARAVIDDLLNGSNTTEDIMLAIAELGSIVAGEV